MRTIRASEIGTFLYCQRAWRLRLEGYEPENQAELAGGTELHFRHGRSVMLSGCLRVFAYALFLSALGLLAFYAAGQVF
jgi:hypothetical protein